MPSTSSCGSSRGRSNPVFIEAKPHHAAGSCSYAFWLWRASGRRGWPSFLLASLCEQLLQQLVGLGCRRMSGWHFHRHFHRHFHFHRSAAIHTSTWTARGAYFGLQPFAASPHVASFRGKFYGHSVLICCLWPAAAVRRKAIGGCEAFEQRSLQGALAQHRSCTALLPQITERSFGQMHRVISARCGSQ